MLSCPADVLGAVVSGAVMVRGVVAAEPGWTDGSIFSVHVSIAVRTAAALSVSASLLMLSGCDFFGPKGTTPDTQTKQRPAAVDKVTAALKPLADKGTKPSSKDFFDTMTKAGYKAKALEATLDTSPLDHDVPSKVFGVRVKGGCVVGEIRDGKVSADLMPPVKSDGSCLLGDVDRPKGVAAPKGEKRKKGDRDNGKGHLPGDDLNAPGGSSSPTSTERSGSGSGSGSESDSGSGSGSDSSSGSGSKSTKRSGSNGSDSSGSDSGQGSLGSN